MCLTYILCIIQHDRFLLKYIHQTTTKSLASIFDADGDKHWFCYFVRMQTSGSERKLEGRKVRGNACRANGSGGADQAVRRSASWSMRTISTRKTYSFVFFFLRAAIFFIARLRCSYTLTILPWVSPNSIDGSQSVTPWSINVYTIQHFFLLWIIYTLTWTVFSTTARMRMAVTSRPRQTKRSCRASFSTWIESYTSSVRKSSYTWP